MAQDINTQELLDALEDIVQRRTGWYIPFKCDWDIVTTRNAVDAAGYYIFFPREILDIVPLDSSCKDKAAVARRWYRNFVSEKDDDVVSIYEFYKTWPTMKDNLFRVLLNREFEATCVERKDPKSSPQLQTEVKGLNHMLFTSAEMAERFINKNCPLLCACIERWKLLTELKEHSREVRVARKKTS